MNVRAPAGGRPAFGLSAAIERFHAAYVNGLPELCRHQPARVSTFDDQLQALLTARCTHDDLLHYTRFKHRRREGLGAAREGRFPAARSDLSLARRCLRTIDTAEVRLVGASSYLAALAYLQYRQLKPAQARRLVERALAIDVRLENEFGLDIMYAHRIQLVHNLVRVEARFGTTRCAIELSVVLLEQLEGWIDASPTSHLWSQRDHRKISSTLRNLLFNLVISDMALLQLQAGPHLAGAASDIYQRHLAHCPEEQRQLFADGHVWLAMRADMESCTLPESLNLASEYLERGVQDLPVLWYETVMSTALQLRDSGETEARSLGENILDEGIRLPFAPQAIRARGFPLPNNLGAAASAQTSRSG